MPIPVHDVRESPHAPPPGDGCAGFLIVEVMIAMAVFLVGFLAVGALVGSTARNNTNGNILTQATMLAAEALEDFKNTPDISTLAVGGPYQDANNPIDERGNAGGIYSRSWTVSDPIGENTSRRIEVTVSWARLGQSRAVTLTTITKGKGT